MKSTSVQAVKIVKENGSMKAYNYDNSDLTQYVSYGTRLSALKRGKALTRTDDGSGWSKWSSISMEDYDYVVSQLKSTETGTSKKTISKQLATDRKFIHDSYGLKPKGLKMSELKWKFLIRSAVRAKNIMMTGPAGSGKTMAAKSLVRALDRPDFYFNLGAT